MPLGCGGLEPRWPPLPSLAQKHDAATPAQVQFLKNQYSKECMHLLFVNVLDSDGNITSYTPCCITIIPDVVKYGSCITSITATEYFCVHHDHSQLQVSIHHDHSQLQSNVGTILLGAVL